MIRLKPEPEVKNHRITSSNNFELFLAVFFSLIISVPIITIWTGFRVNLGGALPSLVPISLSFTILLLFLTAFSLRSYKHFYLVSPVFVLFISIVMVLITGYLQTYIEEDVRTKQAIEIVPTFPESEFSKVTYKPYSNGNEPAVNFFYHLPNAKNRFCEIAEFYRVQLERKGYLLHRDQLTFYDSNISESDSLCPENWAFSKSASSPSVYVEYHNFNPTQWPNQERHDNTETSEANIYSIVVLF